MSSGVSHNRREETIEAKARWYQGLTLAERMDLFCAYTDLALEMNPHLPDTKDLISSKRGAGRPVDLEDVRLLELPKDDTPAS